MSRFPERIAGVAASLAVLAAVVDGLLYPRTHLLAVAALLPLLFTAAAVSILALVRLRLARQAAEEERDQAMLKDRAAGASLFQEADAGAPFTLARSRAQFETWFVSAAPLLLAAAQLLWALRLHRSLPWNLATGADHLLAAAFLAAQAFALFVLGRYLVALGRTREHRLARGPGHAIGIACLGALVAAAAAAATALAEKPEIDTWAARALLALAGLLAAENVLRVVAAWYSPRRGEALASAHETALGGLFIDPGAWARRLGTALDYQFGFAVSESGFARLLRTAIAPLVVCQLLLLLLMSCFVFLGPEEEGWRERLGRPLPDGQLASGFHLKAPWPLESVRRLPVRRILNTQVGFTPDPKQARPASILWTIPHFKQEENFVVPSRAAGGGQGEAVPVNLVTLNIPVEYLITNFFAHAYGFADAAAAVRQIAYRAVTREISGRELPALLGPGREASSARILAATQAECDRVGLGVRIVSVPLTGVHRPCRWRTPTSRSSARRSRARRRSSRRAPTPAACSRSRWRAATRPASRRRRTASGARRWPRRKPTSTRSGSRRSPNRPRSSARASTSTACATRSPARASSSSTRPAAARCSPSTSRRRPFRTCSISPPHPG